MWSTRIKTFGKGKTVHRLSPNIATLKNKLQRFHLFFVTLLTIFKKKDEQAMYRNDLFHLEHL